MWVTFANSKTTHIFFSKNISVYLRIESFNDTLTNVIVSFEQQNHGFITKTSLFKYIENFQIQILIFFISAQNIDYEDLLEPPRRGGSNEDLQPMFLSRNKKKNYTL